MALENVPGLTLLVGNLVVKVNTTGTNVTDGAVQPQPLTVTVAGQNLPLDFRATGTANVTDIEGNLTLAISNIASVTGNFTFAQTTDGQSGVTKILSAPQGCMLSLVRMKALPTQLESDVLNGTLGAVIYKAPQTQRTLRA